MGGGICSLIVSFGLPNRLRALTIKEGLDSLARRISGISNQIDSRLRVLMRVERLRLDALLKTRKPYSPDFADVVTQCTDGLATLTLRTEIAEQLDMLRHRFAELESQSPSPSVIDRTDAALQAATLDEIRAVVGR